jgi:hypothetical protein
MPSPPAMYFRDLPHGAFLWQVWFLGHSTNGFWGKYRPFPGMFTTPSPGMFPFSACH